MTPNKKRLLLLGLLAAVLAFVFLSTHSNNASHSPMAGKNTDVPVSVAVVEQKDFPIEISTFGNTESIASITLKPQTDGLISKVHFNEGQFVQAGQLLFTIDPRPALANLSQSNAIVSRDAAQVAQASSILGKDNESINQAQAILNKDLAQLNFQKAQEKRYENLIQNDYVTREQYEQVVTSRKSAEAVVSADQAAIATARAQYSSDYNAIHSVKAAMRADQAVVQGNQLRLQYYTVRAPFAGRTGALLVHAGDVVQGNVSPMLTIDKMSPVFVTFTVPEQQLIQIQKAEIKNPLKVVLTLPDKTNLYGRLAFSDNMIDPATGTVKLKAIFDNNSKYLWPGQYAQVKLILGMQTNAIIIPMSAVQAGQDGDYVVVIKNEKAEFKPVKLQRTTAQYAVIQSGLQSGDVVVTDGQMQLEPGSKVKIKNPEALPKGF